MFCNPDASNGNGAMCSKETPQLASSLPPVSASASSNGNCSGKGEGKAFKGAAAAPPAALGPIPEGDEYSAMTDEEVSIVSMSGRIHQRRLVGWSKFAVMSPFSFSID